MSHGFDIHNLFQDNQFENAKNIFFTILLQWDRYYEGSAVIGQAAVVSLTNNQKKLCIQVKQS